MAINIDLAARLREILAAQECPATVALILTRRLERDALIEKLRELQVFYVAEFAGLAAHSHVLGEFPQLLKLGYVTPEAAMRTKIVTRRIWRGARCFATEKTTTEKKGIVATRRSQSLRILMRVTPLAKNEERGPNAQLRFNPTAKPTFFVFPYSASFASAACLTPPTTANRYRGNLPKTAQSARFAFSTSRETSGYHRDYRRSETEGYSDRHA